ncbi:MAG: hypothetical protein GY822_10025 [Deltaproteobacteria bacterium]|nr:hypothetical protein [Deltaproteobacteria bacterium]
MTSGRPSLLHRCTLFFFCLAVGVVFSPSAFARPVDDESSPTEEIASSESESKTKSQVAFPAFLKLRRDPTPKELVRDTHYWISNENRLDLFYDDVKDRGGIFIGVGTDQNYLLAAWSKPSVLVLMDFDQAVVDLHLVYRALFMSSSTREDFLKAWEKKNRKATRRLIKTFYKDERRRQKRAKWAFGQARWAVERRMNRVRKHMNAIGMKTFFDDDEQFLFIKELFTQGRVFSLRGDLTAVRTMRSISKAAKAEEQTVGVLYLSNAEQYFSFDWKFRRNISRLPVDDKSLVIRTNGLRSLKRVKGTYYHYNAQSLASFQEWLALKKRRPKNVTRMLKYAEPAEVRGYSHLELQPQEARSRRRERRKAERIAKKKAAKAKRKKERKRRKKKSRGS